MNVQYHAMPRDLLEALGAGGGGPDAIRALAAAEHSKHIVLLWGVVEAAQAAGAEQAKFARHGQDVLAAVQRHAPLTAAWTIRYPSVGAWALRASRGDIGVTGAEPARLAAVAAAAAVRSGFEVEVPVPADGGVVSLPSLGAAHVGSATATVHSSAGRAEIRWAHGRADISPDARKDASGWQGLRSCNAGNFDIVVDDLDPFRMPAVTGVAPRLSAREAGEWNRALEQGWQLLASNHPDIATEVAATIRVIVPLSRSVHGQLSSSSPETFGAVAMSKPPDSYTCAVTYVHEVQHLKLSALLDIVTLTLPDDGHRYYAPWRADPRPIAGLLQGAYAYLGVSRFWQAQRQLVNGAAQLRADSEFALWRAGTARAIDALLSSKRLTAAGADFVQCMSETITACQSEPVSPQAQEIALRESRRHLARWELDNGPVPA